MLSIYFQEHIPINGSGKTTFFKALLGDSTLIRNGLWEIPPYLNIAYLQQFQSFSAASPLTLLKQQCPDWSPEALQHHLSTFLFTDFRTHTQPADTLSEGEKMRLSLALIAQVAPDLIILDEVSNHLDLTTKQHLIDTLNLFEGALLINSHETAFLEELHIDRQAFIQTNGKSGQIVEGTTS
ncbi:MAG: ABC-F family ATP-binding cassette domain-containing protein [Chlamydiia bacterium]|nr:ABC-F family ATP-binding cassette domain-containing protein [Chlamydiia bacterium]